MREKPELLERSLGVVGASEYLGGLLIHHPEEMAVLNSPEIPAPRRQLEIDLKGSGGLRASCLGARTCDQGSAREDGRAPQTLSGPRSGTGRGGHLRAGRELEHSSSETLVGGGGAVHLQRLADRVVSSRLP